MDTWTFFMTFRGCDLHRMIFSRIKYFCIVFLAICSTYWCTHPVLYAASTAQWGYYAQQTFNTLGIELKNDLSNTYYTGDSILIQWRVTNKKEYAFLYIQNIATKAETTKLVRTDSNGNFQIPVELPKDAWRYYIILASGNSFSSSAPEILYLVPNTAAINTKTSQIQIAPSIVYWQNPYISIGEGNWATMQITQLGKTYQKSWKIFILNNIPLQTGNTQITISGNALSSDSPLDQVASRGFVWSWAVLLDRTHEKIGEDLVALRNIRSLGTMQFRIKSWENVLSTYYLTSPSGNVTKYTFPASLIWTNGFLRTNVLIKQNFPMTEAGVYKIETVRSSGIAYFNLPISKNKFWSIVEPMTYLQKTTLRNDKDSIDKNILKKINVMRAGLGLNWLVIDPTLSNLAQKKAIYMDQNNDFAHVDKYGRDFIEFWQTIWIKINWSAAENIAWWTNVSDLFLQDWLEESGSHRYSMLGDKYKKIGIGYVLNNWKTYLVQIFGE